MTDDKKKEKPVWIKGIGWRYETKHNMHRRMKNHNYYGRSIYMITMCVEGRKPLLGNLLWKAQDASDAHVEASELGAEVERCWFEISDHYPDAEPLKIQLMPDHIHGLIFVKREQEVHLGQMIKGFKIGCSRAWWALSGASSYNSQHRTALFEPGYNDSILKGPNQLENMNNYMDDNPRRLAIKRLYPNLFKQVWNQTIGSTTYAIFGNSWLLNRPVRMQVKCHRSDSEENLKLIERQKAHFLEQAKKGAVIVCPCISTGEKEIARAILEAKLPLIVILENGFSPKYKPPGQYFDACADGRLLMLAPWPYHTEKRKITRQQCNQLNNMAAEISSVPWNEDEF